MRYRFVAESVGVSFMGKTVLRSASVWCRPGEITVLLGRNGCGKTTLFKAALGLVSREFGTVRFENKVYLNPRLAMLAREGLFYIPDRGLLSRRRTLQWHRSSLRQSYPGEFSDEIPHALEADTLLDKRPDQMSGGEARRAELALAWSRNPSCLLADEPLASIAPRDQEVLGKVLRDLAGQGCAVVVTGHDVRPLLALGDQVVWMVAGTTHGLGPPDRARNHEQFRREYLGPGV